MTSVTIDVHDSCISIKDPDCDKAIWVAIKQLEEGQMATQQEIDGITTEVQKVASDLQTASGTLQTEIDNLAAANPAVDLSGLRTAVQPLDAAVQALGSLQPLKAEATSVPPAVTPETPAVEAPAISGTPPVADAPPTV